MVNANLVKTSSNKNQIKNIFSFLHSFKLSEKRPNSQTFHIPKTSCSSLPQSFTRTGTFFFSPSLPVFCFSDGSWVKGAGGSRSNGTLLGFVVEYSSTAESSVTSHTWSLDVKDFLLWVYGGTVAPRRKMLAVLTEKSRCRTSEQFDTWLAMNEDQVLREISRYRLCL